MIKKRFKELALTAEEKAEIKDFYNKYHETGISELPIDVYSQFKQTGKRIDYEKLYFDRRKRICGTLMMCKAYGGAHLNELCELLRAVCNEYSWALPAHTANSDDPTREVDLFAAETAMTLTEIAYILSDTLPDELMQRIEHEVTHRVITVFETRRFPWEDADHNWSAVCGGNIGMVYLYRGNRVPERIMNAMAAYLSGIKDDGACLEGVQYWSYGFGFYIYFAALLKEKTGGDITSSDKVKRLAKFGQSMYMGGIPASFSDCEPVAPPLAGLTGLLQSLYPGEIAAPPCKHERSDDCGRWAHYIRSFLYKPDYTKNSECEAVYELSQLYVNHRYDLSLFIKGGCNDEPHNHNDIGSFIVADKYDQLLCELGSGEYVGDYFADDTRYDYLACSSLGHNVPVINGAGQKAGAEYACDSFEYGKDHVRLSIGSAYGAGITVIREIEINSDSIVLHDSFSGTSSVTERFISRIKPVVTGDKTVIGRLCMDHAFEITKTQFAGHDGVIVPVYILEYAVHEDEFHLKMHIVNRVGRIFSALSHHRTCRSAYGGSIQFQNMPSAIVIVDTAH